MATDRDQSRASFDYFSNEYAQALDAFKAIEEQAAMIAAFGPPDELRTYIDQFVEMASRTRQEALDKGETNFADWFQELIEKAEAVRTTVNR